MKPRTDDVRTLGICTAIIGGLFGLGATVISLATELLIWPLPFMLGVVAVSLGSMIVAISGLTEAVHGVADALRESSEGDRE